MESSLQKLSRFHHIIGIFFGMTRNIHIHHKRDTPSLQSTPISHMLSPLQSFKCLLMRLLRLHKVLFCLQQVSSVGVFLKKVFDNSSKVDVVNGLLDSRERPPEALAVTWRPRRHLRSATGKSILASREMPAKQGHNLQAKKFVRFDQ